MERAAGRSSRRTPTSENRMDIMGQFTIAGGRYWGGSTHKGNAIYLHVLRWPADTIRLPPIKRKIVGCSVLTGGRAEVKQTAEGIAVSVPAPSATRSIRSSSSNSMDRPRTSRRRRRPGAIRRPPARRPRHPIIDWTFANCRSKVPLSLRERVGVRGTRGGDSVVRFWSWCNFPSPRPSPRKERGTCWACPLAFCNSPIINPGAPHETPFVRFACSRSLCRFGRRRRSLRGLFRRATARRRESGLGHRPAHRETTATRERAFRSTACGGGSRRKTGRTSRRPAAGAISKSPAAGRESATTCRRTARRSTPIQAGRTRSSAAVAAAWYQREISVPQEWAGRRVALCLEYLNSSAAVFVDGRKAGEIAVSGGRGRSDRRSARPGSKHVLSLLVVARPLQEIMLMFNDTNAARRGGGKVERRGPVRRRLPRRRRRPARGSAT